MKQSKFAWIALACSLAACGVEDGDQPSDETLGVAPQALGVEPGFAVASSAARGELSQALLALNLASFQNGKSNRCIGVDGASTANGALIKQFTCDGTSNQNWLGSGNSNAQNVVTNSKSSKCMGVSGASKTAGANVAQFTCDGTSNQIWLLTLVGGTATNPVLTFQNVNSNMCLGVDGASTANGAQLKQFPCDGTLNQEWRFIPR